MARAGPCARRRWITHHINPWGDIEPCPIIQFTRESIHATPEDRRPLGEKIIQSEFLSDFRALAQQTTRGCIVLERPDLLEKLIAQHGARDATVRGTALQELQALEIRTSQYNPGQEIPEKNWLYRIAKRFWFNDFGLYRGHDHRRTAAPFLLRREQDSVVG